MKIILIFCLIFSTVCIANAQSTKPWKNKKCAVCLTYDDALNVDLDIVIPSLDSLKFRGTFYVPGSSAVFKERLSDWRKAARKGHELGNHTLFHPCEGKAPGREWVKPENDLGAYSMQRLVDEIAMANTLLTAVDGKTVRTFAYPCGDMMIGNSSYVPHIKTMFPAARTVQPKMQTISEINAFAIGSYMINGESGDDLIRLARAAMEHNDLLVFLFHGVGGEHSINVSVEAHSQLLHFLKQNEKDIWVAPLVEASAYCNKINQR
jgi:peptidoglycan-N-acetylglucosamine deacetylase